MKKLLLTALLILFGCSEESDVLTHYEMIKYRTIAYNSLSDRERESLRSGWEEAPVNKGKYKSAGESHKFISNEDFYFHVIDSTVTLTDNLILISVTFFAEDDALLGPLIIIIELNLTEQSVLFQDYNQFFSGV